MLIACPCSASMLKVLIGENNLHFPCFWGGNPRLKQCVHNKQHSSVSHATKILRGNPGCLTPHYPGFSSPVPQNVTSASPWGNVILARPETS